MVQKARGSVGSRIRYSPRFPREITEGPMGIADVGRGMEDLKIRMLPDSRVGIVFVVLDSDRVAPKGPEERKRMRLATKELRRRKAGKDEEGKTLWSGISSERVGELRSQATPLRSGERVYPNLHKALHAAKEHIPASKAEAKEAVSGLMKETQRINARLYDVDVGEPELQAKVRELGDFTEQLSRRNQITLSDIYTDNAATFLGEAIESLKLGNLPIARTKLASAVDVLTEKLAHDKDDVLGKNSRRIAVLEGIIRIRERRNGWIRKGLRGSENRTGAMGELRKSATILDRTGTMQVHIPGFEHDVPKGSVMLPVQRDRIAGRLFAFAESLKNSNEDILKEARGRLLLMRNEVLKGNPHRALDLGDAVLACLKKADELAGKEE